LLIYFVWFLDPEAGSQGLRTLLLLGFLLLSDIQSTKTFPFLNWSSLNFGYWLVTIFPIFVPCQIFF